MRLVPARSVVGAFVAIIPALLFSSCSQEAGDFTRLKLSRKETQQSQILATALKDRPRGVRLALEDIDCFGGETRGWSSWILEKSSLSSEVDRGLNNIVFGLEQRLARRIEAARILWLRTGDWSWLVEWYRLVQRAGIPAVGAGRRLLVSAVDFGDVRDRINLPADHNAALSIEEFSQVLRAKGLAGTNAPQRQR
jgi:hypothetical protein